MPAAQLDAELLHNLTRQVQANCDISDARHAGNYTLCIYLLKMREYYRWIHAFNFSQEFDPEALSAWLREKETVWDEVIDHEFQPIDLKARQYDFFDYHAINANLEPLGLFYHAGIGEKGVSHFFLAELIEKRSIENHSIIVTGHEFARDLTAPPGFFARNEIIIRRESLKRMCWERYQEWNWSRLDNPMGKALAYYDFDQDVEKALDDMVDTELNTLIYHEIGEQKAALLLGKEWQEMMLILLGTKAELLARAVRDHYADCLCTLPYLMQQKNPAPLHFYFANLTHLRKSLFPAGLNAYKLWSQQPHNHEKDSFSALQKLLEQAQSHWQSLLIKVLDCYRNKPQNPVEHITGIIEANPF